MTWHPNKAVLVLSSDLGELFSISWEKEIQKERKLSPLHKHAVKHISWANDTQLLSLDTVRNNTRQYQQIFLISYLISSLVWQAGSFIIWNYTDNGQFQQSIMQEIKDTPVQIAFMTALPIWECYIGCLSGMNLNYFTRKWLFHSEIQQESFTTSLKRILPAAKYCIPLLP